MGMIAWNSFPIDPMYYLGDGEPIGVWKRTIPFCEILFNTLFYLLGIPTDSGLMSVKHLIDKVFPFLLAQVFIDFSIFFRGR